MRLSDLSGKRVVVWGSGREAGAVIRAMRKRGVSATVTVLDEKVAPGQMVEDISVQPFSVDVLRGADYVVRSPGVSIYRPELQGLEVITATGLWFAEIHAPIIAVTGTKGKSTTASLIAHVLNGIGIDARLAGNIGQSPLDFVGESEPQMWVVELSSFQISDAGAAPEVGVLTSLDSDHLDWHGDQQHYIDDKLRLFDKAEISVVNVADPGALAVIARLRSVVAVDATLPVPLSQLFGAHNAQLIRVALKSIEAAGVDLEANQASIASAIASFAPLPHRLEPVGEVNQVLYVNDSLSTNPVAATAAVSAFVGRPISLLLGGYDRGLSFEQLGEFLSTVPDLCVFTMPDSGDRIAAAISGDVKVIHTKGLNEAVTLAREHTPAGGVVLLSPAAASFTGFKNYEERGEAFRSLVAAL